SPPTTPAATMALVAANTQVEPRFPPGRTNRAGDNTGMTVPCKWVPFRGATEPVLPRTGQGTGQGRVHNSKSPPEIADPTRSRATPADRNDHRLGHHPRCHRMRHRPPFSAARSDLGRGGR